MSVKLRRRFADSSGMPLDFKSAMRRTLRVPLPVQSLSLGEAGPPSFLGYLWNVSETGVFVQCTESRAVGTRLALRLRLPGLEERLHCDAAEIVWSRAFASGGSTVVGMGLRFVNLDVSSRATLRDFCADGGPQGATRISRS
ncbi:MAG: PilZ domain-containing protein [Deltaproteobacteria bacterium]|nr:PilZ domain-containing protein [Deltaproteobacteria bacterium]MBW2414362.1 PilZ domain-containing protein [Deltaproteobacteria bacterium]